MSKGGSLIAVAVCALSTLAVGCSLVGRSDEAPPEIATGAFSSARLSYQLRGEQLHKAFQNAEPQDDEKKSPKHEKQEDGLSPMGDIGTLVIEYPHPTGPQHLARARFEFVAVSESLRAVSLFTGWKPSEDDREEWELDIPVQELQRLLTGLDQRGYFGGKSSRTMASKLTVKVGEKESSHRFDQVPELNLLMRRCRRAGRPVTKRAMKVAVSRRMKQDRLARFNHYANLVRSGGQAPVGQPAYPPAGQMPMQPAYAPAGYPAPPYGQPPVPYPPQQPVPTAPPGYAPVQQPIPYPPQPAAPQYGYPQQPVPAAMPSGYPAANPPAGTPVSQYSAPAWHGPPATYPPPAQP